METTKQRATIALIVRRAQRRLLVDRMSPADFLPESQLGSQVDRISRRIGCLIMEAF